MLCVCDDNVKEWKRSNKIYGNEFWQTVKFNFLFAKVPWINVGGKKKQFNGVEMCFYRRKITEGLLNVLFIFIHFFHRL